ncbi:MAG: hypothetical protein Q4F45_06620 [Alistipes sp.]|nr:hypothetical protein [Alistipes sp.]
MKNFRTFFAFAMFAVASFMMMACSDKDDPAPPPAPEPELDVTFDIEVTDITSNGSLITVTPSKDDVLYYFDNIAKDEFINTYGSSAAATAEGAFEKMVAMGMTIEEAIETYASLGVDSWRYDGGLSPDTEYVAYAVAISNEGKALSEGQSFEYRTLAEEQPAVSDITFDIEVTDITSTSANVRIIPSRDDVPYYFDVVSKYILTEFYNGDAAAVVEDMFDSLLENGMPVEEVSEYTKWGEISYSYDDDFSPDEEYVVYAFPINEQGDVIAEGATYNFRTLAEEQPGVSDMTFDIEVTDVTSTSANVRVTPSRDDVIYYFDIIADYSGDVTVLVENMFESMAGGTPIEELIAAYASQGADGWYYDNTLSPDTEYMVYVVPINEQGKAIGEATIDYFTTSPMNTEMDWNVEFGDIHYDGLAFTVTPTDDTVPYYFTVRPQFSHGGAMSDEELLATIMAEDGMMMDYYAVTGEYESLYEWQEFILCSDTAYDLIIFAYSDGQALSGVKKVPFRTKTPETAPADCTFELSYTLGEGNATISVTPSDENLMYMWDVEDKNIVESFGGIEGYVDAYIGDMIENSGAYEIDFARVMGAETEEIGFVAGEYVIWAACVNERGEVVSPIAVEEFVMEESATDASAKATLGSMKKAVKRTSQREVKSMPQVSHSKAGQKLSLKMATMMK